MQTLRYMAAALAAAGLMAVPANATTFVFKGDGGYDAPLANSQACATVSPIQDLCTIVHADGFSYSKDGVNFTATAYAGVDGLADADDAHATRLIQDLSPSDSGLGAFSEAGSINDDQTQFESKEAISFVFDHDVHVTDVEFNAGGDTNCSTFGDEGPCGSFQLFIDGVDFGVIVAQDLIASLGIGQAFLLIALDMPNEVAGGFTIAQFTVSEVPVPAALPLLLSGLAGLGFASRRRKAA